MAKGNFYWGVKVPEHISKDKEIYLHADIVNVAGNNLIFLNQNEKGLMQVVFTLSEGNWHALFSASIIDGKPMACEHWKGEIEK